MLPPLLTGISSALPRMLFCADGRVETGVPLSAMPPPPFTPARSSAVDPKRCCRTLAPPSFSHSSAKALTTIAQRAARNQQQRGLFPLLVDMSGGVTRFVFRRKREIAEVSAAFDFSGWLRASTLSGVLLLITSSTFSFQQRPNHQGGAILLRLGEQLAYRLAGGVVNFQFRRRVGGGCDHGLRLCGRRGNRLGGRGSGSLRRGGCCRRLGCRFRSRRCLVLRRGLNRISAASGGGKIADFCLRRTHHIIITGDIRPPGRPGREPRCPSPTARRFWRLQSPAG